MAIAALLCMNEGQTHSQFAAMTEAQRRAHILAAADRLLRHYGPQKTTVADVAREAGVGVGTVYLEFSSKDAIVEELSRARHRVVLDGMRAAAGAAGTAGERLTGALDARLSAYLSLAEEGAHACDLVHCVSAAVKIAQASFHEEERALVAEILRQGVAAGEFSVEEPDLAARTVLRAYVTFTLPWLMGKDRDEIRRAIAAMHAIVLRGLLLRHTPPVPYKTAAERRKRA
jgi:AcrR family transcriptional regulator